MAEPKQGETANTDGQRVQEPTKDISVKPKPSVGGASRGTVRGCPRRRASVLQSSPTGTSSPGITGTESWNMSSEEGDLEVESEPKKGDEGVPEEGSPTRGVKARAGQEGCRTQEG